MDGSSATEMETQQFVCSPGRSGKDDQSATLAKIAASAAGLNSLSPFTLEGEGRPIVGI